MFETKDASKSYTLNVAELKATMTRALRQDRMAVWLIRFREAGVVAEVRLVPDNERARTL